MASQPQSREINDFLTRVVAEGFSDPDEIIDSAVEMFSEDSDEDEGTLRDRVRRGARRAVQAHLRAQAGWPEVTDCDRLDAAFDELNAAGIVARQNFSCCSNCGHGEMGGEMRDEEAAGATVRGYTFYHMQDTESAVYGGLYLKYGAARDGDAPVVAVGREIVATLNRHGLSTEWNGRGDTGILVHLDWKRRRHADGSAR
jgi:hypothetical protein